MIIIIIGPRGPPQQVMKANTSMRGARRVACNSTKLRLKMLGSAAQWWPVSVIGNFDAFLDPEMSLHQHLNIIVTGCFDYLGRLKQICQATY